MGKFSTEQLEEVRSFLINEIQALNAESLNHKPDENAWSIAQVCEHVALVEKATIKAIAWGLKNAEVGPVERKNVQSALDRTEKIQAPDVVMPKSETRELDQVLEFISSTRTELLDYLETIEDPDVLTKKSVKHPVFGRLSLAQWIELLPYHEQRHIEQIKEIKAGMKAN